MSTSRILPVRLTAIIADSSPMFAGEPVAHRRVTVDLTEQQAEALKLRFLGQSVGFESFSTVILELP